MSNWNENRLEYVANLRENKDFKYRWHEIADMCNDSSLFNDFKVTGNSCHNAYKRYCDALGKDIARRQKV